MNKKTNIIWGIILIIVGILLGGNALNLFKIDIFFAGWWTLFIIVPCFIGFFNEKDKTGNLIGFIIGVLLLLAAQKILSFDIVWKLFIPVILVIIGLSMLFKEKVSKKVNEEIKKLNSKMNPDEGYAAIFSSQDLNFDKEEFKGTNLNAVFGGIKLDLREAVIKSDVVINASAIFGGIDIYIPKNVNIKIKPTALFGGVSSRKNGNKEDGKYTIYINATCTFGGVEIKWVPLKKSLNTVPKPLHFF